VSDDKSGFSPSDREALKRGPRHLFTLVAKADDHLDRQERAAFEATIQAHATASDELLRSVMAELAADLGEEDHVREAALEGLREIRRDCRVTS